MAKLHYLTLDIYFLKDFTLSGSYINFHNYIGPVSLKKTGLLPDGTQGEYVVTQPVNYNIVHKGVNLSYEKNINSFSLEGEIRYTHSSSNYKSERIRKGYWKWNAKISYYCRPWNLSASIAYYGPDKYNITTPQTWMKYDTDQFRLNLHKSFLNGSLFVAASYKLPLHLVSNSYYTYVSSPVMTIDKITRTEHLLDNELSLTITYRLNWGNRINRMYKRIHEEE